MPAFYSFNGQINPVNQPFIKPDNRLFRFGDGLFETIRIAGGKPLFLRHHYVRLVYGCDAIGLELNPDFSPRVLKDQLLQLARANEMEWGRARLSVYRKAGLRYVPTDNSAEVFLEMEALPSPAYAWNDTGLNIGLFDGLRLHAGPLSFMKGANAMPYVLASKWAAESGIDDALLMNESGRIVEATASNIFVFIDGKLISPPVSEGPVDGVMRRVVIGIARRKGLPFEESVITTDHLGHCSEIFLTNAISGIRWVQQYDNCNFENEVSRGLFLRLEELLL